MNRISHLPSYKQINEEVLVIDKRTNQPYTGRILAIRRPLNDEAVFYVRTDEMTTSEYGIQNVLTIDNKNWEMV